MEINIADSGNEKVACLIGNLDGISSGEVTEKLLEIVEEGNKLTIDMAQCFYVSSAGLRTLLTIGKSVKMKNGCMRIINLCEEVQDVMEMTGFSSIFKGFEGVGGL